MKLVVKGNIAQKKQAVDFFIINTLQIIIKDPEFLALGAQKQLRVLIMIFNILKSHFKLTLNMKKKRYD